MMRRRYTKAIVLKTTRHWYDRKPIRRIKVTEKLVQAARTAIPAVVQIRVFGYSGSDQRSVLDPRHLVSDEWTGSGFFIRIDNEEGYILTNSHVIRNASSVFVLSMLTSAEVFEAEIIGLVPNQEPDIGLIRLKAEELERFREAIGGEIPYLQFADLKDVHRGMQLKAIGYPYDMSEPNISGGEVTNFVSGDDQFPERLVTDAAINPGNSGGPAIIESGEVVGINTSIVLFANNIGFITPIRYANILLPCLQKKREGSLTDLGCRLQGTSKSLADHLGMKEAAGLCIRHVYPGGLARSAGLKKGDVITGINEYRFDRYGNILEKHSYHRKNIFDVVRLVPMGESLDIHYFRDGKEQTIAVAAKAPPTQGIRSQPMVEKRRFVNFQGLIIQELSFEIMAALTNAYEEPYLIDFQGRVPRDPRLAITFIDYREASQDIFVSMGDIIERVNDKRVQTLEDFCEAVNSGPATRLDFLGGGVEVIAREAETGQSVQIESPEF